MKYCPKCQNTYADETQTFCLQDGSTLVHSDPQAETFKMKAGEANVENPPADVTRVFKTALVQVGDYIDFVTPQYTIRTTVKECLEEELPYPLLGSLLSKKQLAARLYFTVDGLLVGGSGTKQLGFNEFLVPVSEGNVQVFNSVYVFYVGEDRAVIFRLLVKHINIQSQKVELDIAYFRYLKI